MIKQKPKILFLIIGVFSIIYVLVSLVNHYNFRTYALDLGAYTNALYDYLHFSFNDSMVFNHRPENLLADHFDIYLIIFSPLSLIFRTYTLLIVQIAAIIAGGYGVYKYFTERSKSTQIAILAIIYFYLFFGIYSALSFDYHSNVIAASIVPWFFLFVEKKNFKAATIVFIAIIVGKENLSLWFCAISLGIAIINWKDKKVRHYNLIIMTLSLIYFIIITSFVMPALSVDNRYPHFHYSTLGDSPREALIFIITNPLVTIKNMFINHTGIPLGDYLKLELMILLFASGLWILFKKPAFIVMLIPIFIQKLLHNNIMMWGINQQYSIEFAPIMAIGIFTVIGELKSKRTITLIGTIILFMTASSTIRSMDNTVLFYDKSKIRIYKADHYQRNYDVKEVHNRLSQLPKDAVISAQSPFVPHLALRESIYQFPTIIDAEYIIYSEFEEPFPLNQKQFGEITTNLENSNDWQKIYKQEGLTILKRIDKK